MNLGGKIINIHCNRLPWNEVIKKFEPLLQQKIKLSAEDNFLHKGEILKDEFGFDKNTDFIKKYKRIPSEYKKKYNLPEIDSEEYKEIFRKKNWFQFCKIKHNFYDDYNEAIYGLQQKHIILTDPEKNWKEWSKLDERLPRYPKYYWTEFEYKYFNIDKNSKKLFM